MSLQYTLRPISDRTSFTGPPLTGQRNPFEATWRSTLVLLEKEVWNLDGRNVVLEIDVRERDIRADGTLRADARTPSSPGVRLAFESRHGPMIYATDRYGWNRLAKANTHPDRNGGMRGQWDDVERAAKTLGLT